LTPLENAGGSLKAVGEGIGPFGKACVPGEFVDILVNAVQTSCEVDQGEGGGRIAFGVTHLSGQGVDLLAEAVGGEDGFGPLAHEVRELGVSIVVFEPQGRAQGGERLAWTGPGVVVGVILVGWVIDGHGGQRESRPEACGIENVFFENSVGEFLIRDVFLHDTEEDVAADADRIVAGIAIVETQIVLVEAVFHDGLANGFGKLLPLVCLRGFTEDLCHFRQGQPSAVDGGGKIGRQVRQNGEVWVAACGIVMETGFGESVPAGAVIVPGVPFAEGFTQACSTRVSVLLEPAVPPGAGVVSFAEEGFVLEQEAQGQGGSRDGDDHLDLGVGNAVASDAGGETAVGALEVKEDTVIIESDGGVEGRVDEAFVGGAFEPDAEVVAAFEEERTIVSGDAADVAAELANGGEEFFLETGVIGCKCYMRHDRFVSDSEDTATSRSTVKAKTLRVNRIKVRAFCNARRREEIRMGRSCQQSAVSCQLRRRGGTAEATEDAERRQ